MDWLARSCALIFALSLVGGLVPLFLRRTERLQHMMLAFASGIFLGAVFLHLLPEVAAMALEKDGAHSAEVAVHATEAGGPDHADHAEHEGHDDHALAAAGHAGHGHGSGIWMVVLLGVVGLYLLENLVFRAGSGAIAGQSSHLPLGYAAFFGLSVHAFATGLGLSAGRDVEALQGPLLVSVLSHKAVESFSLCAAFLLTKLPARRILLYVVLFSIVTPLGAYVRTTVAPDLGAEGLHYLTAFAAGTFLFVALCDLLPEVFHHREDTVAKVGLLAAGIATSLLIHGVQG